MNSGMNNSVMNIRKTGGIYLFCRMKSSKNLIFLQVSGRKCLHNKDNKEIIRLLKVNEDPLHLMDVKYQI